MPRFIPESMRAGDTTAFTASADFRSSTYTPENGWQMTYSIRGDYNLTATGSQENSREWIVTFSAADTEAVSEGLYEYIGRVDKDGEKYTIDSGVITILPNLETAGAGSRIVHVQAMINAIQDALEGRITADVQSFTVRGRSLIHIPAEELLTMRTKYLQELKRLRKGGKREYTDITFEFRRRE